MEHGEAPESAAAKAVRLLGGPVKAADRLGVERYQTVQSWVKNLIPAIYCPQIVDMVGGEVKLWDLRPDDWYRYWPQAVRLKGAPPIPAAAAKPERATAAPQAAPATRREHQDDKRDTSKGARRSGGKPSNPKGR